MWDPRCLSSPFWSKLKPLHNLEALEGGALSRGDTLCFCLFQAGLKPVPWLTEQRLIRFKSLLKKKKK